MFVYDDQMKVLHSTLLENKRYFAGFGTRQAGDGRKRSTLLAFCENNSVPYETLVVPDQIHSVNAESVAKNGEIVQLVDMTDGVITRENHVLLSIVTADCVPILYEDTKNGVIGVSHQGWRGTLKRMVMHMIDKMISQGAEIAHIKVAIGPSIGACCYNIDEERMYDFLAEFEEIKDKMLLTRGGSTHLNLLYLNYYQLIKKGVHQKNIDFFPFCTKCDENRFFSFRRDDAAKYGEMFSYIMKV